MIFAVERGGYKVDVGFDSYFSLEPDGGKKS